ncbi:hypothetical protein U9M48_022409 [Paspalum notatum var. saurae]|uniref:Transcription repressor n=1 Tax=Paspalum notatum var. saurae TaxID=547442 RepID=A0AAQ3WV50_PASNO
MKSPAVPAKRRHGGGGGGAAFALGCGCKDAKSVSVSVCASASPSATTGTSTTAVTRRRSAGLNPWASTTTDTLTTLTSASSSSLWEDAVAELGYKDGSCRMLPAESSAATPSSFSGLLRELSELERSVAAWGASRKGHLHEDTKLSPPPTLPLPLPPRHGLRNKAKRDLRAPAAGEEDDHRPGDAAGLEGSVAVVKQSDDPLGDFRRSMLQMIVENGIVAGEDLREMLRRFLTLNAPHHHDAILQAFAEIWDDVFVAASLDRATSVSRREPGSRPPVPAATPPRHRRSPPAWRV